MRRLALAASLLGLLVIPACGDSPTAPSSPASTTFLSLVSVPGDQIGNGFTQRVGLSQAEFWARVVPLFDNRQSVEIGVTPLNRSEPWWWTLRLTMPPGQPLRTGAFEGVRRWPGEGNQAGMDFSGSGSGCSSLTGRFDITELVLGAGSTPDRLRVTFEQKCDSAGVPIKGEVSIAANPWR